jgi:hypothetical protein
MGAQQIKIFKRQLGEQLIAKLGLVGEVRHGLPFWARAPTRLSQPPAPMKFSKRFAILLHSFSMRWGAAKKSEIVQGNCSFRTIVWNYS